MRVPSFVLVFVACLALPGCALFESEASDPIDLRFAIRDSVESETASATIEFSPRDRDTLGLNATTHTVDMAKAGTSSPVQFGSRDVRTRFKQPVFSDRIEDADNPCLQDDVTIRTDVSPDDLKILLPAGFCLGDNASDTNWSIKFDFRDNMMQFGTKETVIVEER